MLKIIYPICCGMDVHKSFVVACIATTNDCGVTTYKSKRFSTFTNDLRRCAAWLAEHHCRDVCMESTGKYWIPVYNILEATCTIVLAHPKYVKAIRGKKTDKKDAKWIADLFKAWETAPKQPPQSPNLANLLMKYLSVQREKSQKYSQRWQQQHTADELKTIAAAVNYLSEHGISNLDELDASLSSVSNKAYSIRDGMKTAEQRMKELQKLMEYGRNYQTYKPIQDEYRQIRWKGKQEKFAEARRAELTLWDAANRYLHAHLPEGVKTLPISAWEKEYTALKAQREAEYDTLKETRAEVAELQKIRRCVDIALRADQPEQTQSRTKRHEQER